MSRGLALPLTKVKHGGNRAAYPFSPAGRRVRSTQRDEGAPHGKTCPFGLPLIRPFGPLSPRGGEGEGGDVVYPLNRFSRMALPSTKMLDSAMAPAASIGESVVPVSG